MANTYKNLSDRAAPAAEDLEQQIAELRREISSLAKNISAFGAAKADGYRSDIEDLAADAMSASMNAFNRAKDEALSLEESFEDQVRLRPLQAIGIALGVGFLAALLTRR